MEVTPLQEPGIRSNPNPNRQSKPGQKGQGADDDHRQHERNLDLGDTDSDLPRLRNQRSTSDCTWEKILLGLIAPQIQKVGAFICLSVKTNFGVGAPF